MIADHIQADAVSDNTLPLALVHPAPFVALSRLGATEDNVIGQFDPYCYQDHFTSNLSPKQLGEVGDVRLASIVREAATPIEMRGEDRRLLPERPQAV